MGLLIDPQNEPFLPQIVLVRRLLPLRDLEDIFLRDNSAHGFSVLCSTLLQPLDAPLNTQQLLVQWRLLSLYVTVAYKCSSLMY